MRERVLVLAMLAGTAIVGWAGEVSGAGIEDIATIVVIYAENRSFDNLYGSFPGANGLSRVTPADYTQLDRDGSVLKELPPIWDGLTAKGFEPPVTQAQTEHLANAPFAIDDPKGFNTPLSVTTRDLWHRFYENQMQIDGGKNDRFAAYADSGALVMGHYGKHQTAAMGFRQTIHAGGQLLHGRVRRLLPQSFRVDLRLYADLSECRSEPGQGLDLGRRGRRRDAQTCRGHAQIGDRGAAQIRQ